jgi:uncharacterized repeat protein (TIGR01451 family)
VSISQSAATSPISPGQNEVYTILVSNIGNADTDSGAVSVTDKLPSTLTYVSATATNGFSCTNSAPTVKCTGTLAQGNNSTIKLTATVSNTATGGPINNESDVADSSAAGDSGTSDKSATTTVSLNGTGIDLAVQSMKATPDPVNQGGVLTYTSVIANNGSQDSGNFTIQQVLPTPGGAFTLISGVASHGFNCAPDSASAPTKINCTGDLAPGTSTTLTVQLEISGSASGALTSTVTANPDKSVVESDYTNNTKTAVTTVTSAQCASPCVDLSQSNLTANPSPVPSGSILTYNYEVGNAGTLTAHGVDIFVSLANENLGDIDKNTITANASNGYTCDTNTSFEDVVCYDHSSGCTYSFTTFTLSCSGSQHSDLAPKAGVMVTVSAKVIAVKDSMGNYPTINSDAFFQQSTTDFSPGDDGEMLNNTNVVAAGPATRGKAVLGRQMRSTAVACTSRRVRTRTHGRRTAIAHGRKRAQPGRIIVCAPRSTHTPRRHVAKHRQRRR